MLTLLLTAPLYLAARLLGGAPSPAESPPRAPVPMALVRCPGCRGVLHRAPPRCATCGGCGEVWRPV